MSSTTTCDGCGVTSKDGAKPEIKEIYGFRLNPDWCERCWNRAVAAVAETPDPTSAIEIEAAVASAVAAATAPLQAEASELRQAARDLESRVIDFRRRAEEAEGTCEQLGERGRDLDRALGEERKERAALDRREREIRFALAEVLAMLGKKARAKYAERLAEIAKATGVEAS